METKKNGVYSIHLWELEPYASCAGGFVRTYAFEMEIGRGCGRNHQTNESAAYFRVDANEDNSWTSCAKGQTKNMHDRTSSRRTRVPFSDRREVILHRFHGLMKQPPSTGE